jgi:hypothetical protein
VSNATDTRSRGVAIVVAAWALLFALALLAAVPQIDRLGLYYDEAFLAQQARDFVEPGREQLHPASVRPANVRPTRETGRWPV